MEGLRDAERDSLLRALMGKEGLQALLALFPEDLVMVGGGWSCLGLALCLYPAEGQPVFYAAGNEPEDLLPQGFLHRRFAPGDWVQAGELLSEDLRRLGVESGRLGVAADEGQHAMTSFAGESSSIGARAIEAVLGGFGTRDATSLFTAAGQRKTTLEVEALRRANAVAGEGLRAFKRALVPGVSEAEVAAEVEAAIQRRSGHEGRNARGWAQVQGGANVVKGGTFSRSSGLRLAAGDMVLIELGTCVDGYWSDLTRTMGVGELGSAQVDLIAAVRAAQSAAIEAVRPGVSHEEVDAAARRVLGERGFGAGFTHACGHHVGFRYHDRGLGLVAGNRAPLEEGMVITIEPGCYGLQYGGAARIEDNILVGPRGAVLLSPREIA